MFWWSTVILITEAAFTEQRKRQLWQWIIFKFSNKSLKITRTVTARLQICDLWHNDATSCIYAKYFHGKQNLTELNDSVYHWVTLFHFNSDFGSIRTHLTSTLYMHSGTDLDFSGVWQKQIYVHFPTFRIVFPNKEGRNLWKWWCGPLDWLLRVSLWQHQADQTYEILTNAHSPRYSCLQLIQNHDWYTKRHETNETGPTKLLTRMLSDQIWNHQQELWQFTKQCKNNCDQTPRQDQQCKTPNVGQANWLPFKATKSLPGKTKAAKTSVWNSTRTVVLFSFNHAHSFHKFSQQGPVVSLSQKIWILESAAAKIHHGRDGQDHLVWTWQKRSQTDN